MFLKQKQKVREQMREQIRVLDKSMEVINHKLNFHNEAAKK